MYSHAFNYAVAQTLTVEGVFSDDPKDHGGPTKYGVTAATWMFYRAGDRNLPHNIEDISIAHATDVYWQLFWDALNLDKLNNNYIAAEVFDSAVNCGKNPTVIMLQEAVNYCRLENFDPIKVDGCLGPITLAAANKLIALKYALPLYKAMNGEQYIWYKRLADPHFSRGWTRRLPNPEGMKF